jgi:hypothetical protein
MKSLTRRDWGESWRFGRDPRSRSKMKLSPKFSNHRNIENWRTYTRTNIILHWSHLTTTCMRTRPGNMSRNTCGSQLTQARCNGHGCQGCCGNGGSAGWYIGGGFLLGRCAGRGGPLLLEFPLGLDPLVVGTLLGALCLASIARLTSSKFALHARDLQPLASITGRL